MFKPSLILLSSMFCLFALSGCNETTVNAAVINYECNAMILEATSYGEGTTAISDEHSVIFATGGHVNVDTNNKKIEFGRLVPGDSFSTKIEINNKSNIKTIIRYLDSLTASEEKDLNAITVNYKVESFVDSINEDNYRDWNVVEATQGKSKKEKVMEITISIQMPVELQEPPRDNSYELSYSLEAKQGNALITE